MITYNLWCLFFLIIIGVFFKKNDSYQERSWAETGHGWDRERRDRFFKTPFPLSPLLYPSLSTPISSPLRLLSQRPLWRPGGTSSSTLILARILSSSSQPPLVRFTHGASSSPPMQSQLLTVLFIHGISSPPLELPTASRPHRLFLSWGWLDLAATSTWCEQICHRDRGAGWSTAMTMEATRSTTVTATMVVFSLCSSTVIFVAFDFFLSIDSRMVSDIDFVFQYWFCDCALRWRGWWWSQWWSGAARSIGWNGADASSWPFFI